MIFVADAGVVVALLGVVYCLGKIMQILVEIRDELRKRKVTHGSMTIKEDQDNERKEGEKYD